jgi:hypothetical protein
MLRPRKSSPNELTRTEIFRSTWKTSGDWKGYGHASRAVRIIPVAILLSLAPPPDRCWNGYPQCQTGHHHLNHLGFVISTANSADIGSRCHDTGRNHGHYPQRQPKSRGNEASSMKPQLRRPDDPNRLIVACREDMEQHI